MRIKQQFCLYTNCSTREIKRMPNYEPFNKSKALVVGLGYAQSIDDFKVLGVSSSYKDFKVSVVSNFYIDRVLKI